jgi:hypothetical protein
MTVTKEDSGVFVFIPKELIWSCLQIDFTLVLTNKAAFIFHAGIIVKYEENLYPIPDYWEYLKMSYLTS